MEVARGRLEDDGKVLLYDIEVTFEIIVRPSGHKIWRGWLRVSGEHDPVSPGTHRLVLDDGRSGEIITGPVPPLKGSVPFRGSGPLYQPEDDT